MSDPHTSMAQPFRFLPLGDAALMVEFGNEIDPGLNERAITFAETVAAQRWDGVLDVVPTYCSVTIHVDLLYLDVDALMEQLQQLPHTASHQRRFSGTHHTIPVLYGSEWGPDLEDVAAFETLCRRSHSIARLGPVPCVHAGL
jgi:inhibitor of KinA